jgi:hypothetical protein
MTTGTSAPVFALSWEPGEMDHVFQETKNNVFAITFGYSP